MSVRVFVWKFKFGLLFLCRILYAFAALECVRRTQAVWLSVCRRRSDNDNWFARVSMDRCAKFWCLAIRCGRVIQVENVVFC